MAASNFSLSDSSIKILHELAAQTGREPQEVLDEALAAWQRKVFIDRVNAAYGELRRDPAAWAEVEAERASMAGSLLDGLDAKEVWEPHVR
jgi:hypothetical protein